MPEEASEKGEQRGSGYDSTHNLRAIQKKDSPDESDVIGQAALAHAQEVQLRLIEANVREGKPQTVLVAAGDVLCETRTWPVPMVESVSNDGSLYGNLYPHVPPSHVRCVVDGFVSPSECRDCVGHCVQGMHSMFRRGGQTSLPVTPKLLERRMGAAGASLISSLVERTRLRIEEDFSRDGRRPVLFESGALLTRIQAEWEHDMWEISGEEEHAYWNVHVDKANVASYDYAALLYLNSQGEHFQGGDFAFVDAREDCLVSPCAGRLLTFTAGPENLHQVRRVTQGTRFVLAMWFTLSSAHARKDD